jgi:DNA polymerase III epsilon subunit-like protein
MKIIIFDTETTGLPESYNTSILETTKWPYIVQISWMVYDTDLNEVVTYQDHIINCSVNIPEESSKIHGITNSCSKRKGIPIEKAMDLFDRDLNTSDMVVAHNISFDKRVYMVEAIRNKRRQYFTVNGVRKTEYCTMKENVDFCNIERTSKCGFRYIKYPSLVELHDKLFGFIPKGAHDSMADVLICLRCYLKRKHEMDIVKIDRKLSKMYELYCGTY